jgi:hypothetical protein
MGMGRASSMHDVLSEYRVVDPMLCTIRQVDSFAVLHRRKVLLLVNSYLCVYQRKVSRSLTKKYLA